MDLTGREIVLGVTGGIAAYKSAEIVSRLRHLGANVHVIMTKNATEFVSPLTFQTLSANQVVTDTFAAPEYWNVEHVALAKLAEVFVIAPATANILAKMANGIADDMLSTTVLATKAPILTAPAMNTGMWTAEATEQNVKTLKERGVLMIGPESGILACGDEGAGRMSEPEAIVEEICRILRRKQDFAGKKMLVTAGATRERLDPVRFITNDSSGKMGFAIAEAARDRGAEVTVIRGSVTAEIPAGIRMIPVESAQDLYDAMMKEAPGQDIIIQGKKETRPDTGRLCRRDRQRGEKRAEQAEKEEFGYDRGKRCNKTRCRIQCRYEYCRADHGRRDRGAAAADQKTTGGEDSR